MFLAYENKLKWNWVIIACIITCFLTFAGIFGLDIPLYNFLHQFNWRIWDVIGNVFSTKNWLAISLIIVVIFYIRKLIQTKSKFNLLDMYSKIRSSYAFWVFCSVLSAALIGGILKIVLGRMRPIFYEALNITGFFPFTMDWAFHSMPSGHTLASFAGLIMIGMLAPRGRWYAFTFAVIIGLSRVCVGAHWPSDIVVGAFIGIVAANIVKYVLSKRAK
ncbi:MAG: phosphatase PAP2 family protein [Alphaproteobacteria bacterium]|nr:phosphatase PAP2 family protein [Alphaproteobacteria bacterium]